MSESYRFNINAYLDFYNKLNVYMFLQFVFKVKMERPLDLSDGAVYQCGMPEEEA